MGTECGVKEPAAGAPGLEVRLYGLGMWFSLECFIGIHETLGSHPSTKKEGMECGKEGAVEVGVGNVACRFFIGDVEDERGCSCAEQTLPVSLCFFGEMACKYQHLRRGRVK